MKNIFKNNWSRKAIIYQIYPRSFKDSNNDGVGDLEGIIQKLDYLNDGTDNSLGINAIWLSPVYRSPMYDFGYDVSDYFDIDPIFGDMKTFDNLVTQAHKRGIRIIMDFVANHTSSENPWFLESKSSRDNPKRDWYIWKDPKADGSVPNNWISVFGGSVWEFDEKTNQYYLHSFLKEQPDLNWRNKEVQEMMDKVLEFWISKGVDGFRSDAIYHLVKDSKFRDDPINPEYKKGIDDEYNSLIHIYSQGRNETLETINTFCEILGHYKNKFMVSEAYLGDIANMLKFYRACDNKLESPMNFVLMSLPWNAKSYRDFIDEFDHSLGEDSWPNYVVGNHDRPRLATRRGEDKTRLIAMLLLTLRGLPFIYNGDEIDMENNNNIPIEKRKDASGRDGERTPLQWNSSQYSGFSSVEPWLPVNDDYKYINIETESEDPSSLLNLYKKLIYLRKKSKALTEGSYESVDTGDLPIFCYIRRMGNEKYLVILNFSDKNQNVTLNMPQDAKLIYNTHLDKKDITVKLDNVNLRAYEGYLLSI